MPQQAPLRNGCVNVSGARDCARPYLFISDLHLSDTHPRTTAAFEHFVRVTANHASAVFILGDLFEYWIGDDALDAHAYAARIATLLHTFAERGIALYIMHGNRDFLLGKRFFTAAGALWLPDPSVITAFGQRLALAHGDAQCTADFGYQYFRRLVHQRPVQKFFLAWPLAWRRALAQRMRTKSAAGRVRAALPRYDVTREGIDQLADKTRAQTIIHGHTHQPAQHREITGIRWVLPDWELDHAPARGGYLCLDAEGIRALPLDQT